MISLVGASILLKLSLINLTSVSDSQIAYSYVPICEIVKRSFITPIMDYYEKGIGKTDFLYISNLHRDAICDRNCNGCLYGQCPDKVAAYVLYLANKYNIDKMRLVEYLIQKNRIKGISLNGNYFYAEKLRQMDEIPFTAESRNTVCNIAKYIVNRKTVGSDKIPYIPFNLVIYTNDEQMADKTATVMSELLRYYLYLSVNGLDLITKKFSTFGFRDIIKIINDAKTPFILHLKEMDLVRVIGQENGIDQNITLQMSKLLNCIKENNKKIILFISGEKSKLDGALSEYSDFYDGLLSHHLTITDMSAGKIVQSIKESLSKTYSFEDGFETALESYVIDKYGESELKSNAFIDLSIKNIIFNHYKKEINVSQQLLCKDIPAATSRRSEEEIWSDMNNLTGLENVKEEIKGIEQFLTLQKKLANSNRTNLQKPNMHMVFTGNPGTGKTTVARLMAEILYGIGFIKQNKVIEVSAKDLIGQYIGHTAPITAQKCESAYGGVLFIDEAYTLATEASGSASNSFRSECIAELIKQMEDNRDRLIIIFAGYTDEINKLLDSNPGFASRIAKKIQFNDYSSEQLLEMFMSLISRNGLRMEDRAVDCIKEVIQQAKFSPNFGNARFVRNLFEKVLQQHAKNTFTVDDLDSITTVCSNDIPNV